LLSREGLLRGGKRGPVIVPGAPSRSLLIASVEQSGDLKMPPGQKLSDGDIAGLRRWIELGAPWPEGAAGEPASQSKTDDLWAFRPLRHYDPPSRAANPIDAFVLRKLEEKGWRPAPAADRRTLIRRATFDLTGLPPTPQEVATFLHDATSDRDAFAKVVERLPASPRNGERWGRHWLDVARYADTGGYSNDFERPHAWRYRELSHPRVQSGQAVRSVHPRADRG
jgi:Protein of unknown function (DUF1549)/Planctomycete cytochrome C